MRMHVGGEWVDKSNKIDVLSPFDGSVVDTVPKGDANDVENAIQTAERGAKIMAVSYTHLTLPTTPYV